MKARTHLNKEGYLVFDDNPDHFVHIWVAGKKYGKEQLFGKEVHHLDGDKLNNDPENLILLTKEDHYYLTRRESKIEFLSRLIAVFSLIYILIIFLIGYTNILNKEANLAIARVCVLIIFLLALELNFGYISKVIRRGKSPTKPK